MSNIELKIQAQGNNAEVKIEGANDDQRKQVIVGLFGLFGVDMLSAVAETVQEGMKQVAAASAVVQSQSELERVAGTTVSHPALERVSRVDQAGQIKPKPPDSPSDRAEKAQTNTFSNKDVIKPVLARNQNKYATQTELDAKEMNPAVLQWLQTDPSYERGTKTSPEGLQLYRADYTCPRCGQEHYRYCLPTNEYCKCRGCQTKIAIWPSHPEGLPNRDEDGAFLFGNIEYPK